MRSYTHDIEKLQKEIELLQKQNVELKQELSLAKEQIIEFEKNAMEVRHLQPHSFSVLLIFNFYLFFAPDCQQLKNTPINGAH